MQLNSYKNNNANYSEDKEASLTTLKEKNSENRERNTSKQQMNQQQYQYFKLW
jgi:hypothetical protein